jgi:tetratricopeptide (TPR) repeat protein
LCRGFGRGGCHLFAQEFQMSSRNTAILLLVLVLGFAAIWHLQAAIDVQRAAILQERDDLLVTSPNLLKVTSLEYAPLLADVYWTRAVQYYGQKHAGNDPNLMLLWPLLNIATTLDPNLLPAYRFGAMFLSDAPPRGAGLPDLAVQLIERGIQANPDYWRFYEDLGFIYYFDKKDYAKASQAFLDGSRNPDAKIWMKVMAAKIAAEGESFETSAFLWHDVYQSATDPATKQGALEHLQLLEAQQDCRQLDKLGDEYEKRFAHRATRIIQFVQAGLLRKVPADPLGFPYELGEDGKASLNSKSPLLQKQKLFELAK